MIGCGKLLLHLIVVVILISHTFLLMPLQSKLQSSSQSKIQQGIIFLMSKTQTPSPRGTSYPSQPSVLDPKAARQAALAAVFAMLMSILFFNLACYSLRRVNSRLSGARTSLLSKPLELPSDTAALSNTKSLEWDIALGSASAISKLCWAANFSVLLASCLGLVVGFPLWLGYVSHISSTVRNYALVYGLGGGIAGLVFVHIVLVPRLRGRDSDTLVAVNSILVLFVTGLAYGTI
jgi:hypothetical protein